MMDNLARRRYTVRMELQIERKPDGFAGETYIVLPTEAFSDYIGHPLVRRLYLTDAGFFPHAAHHYRERSEGIEEYIFLCCTSGRGVVEVQGRTFPLRDNEALCIPRLCPHRYWADEEDPWSLLWVHFQGEDCGYYPLDRPQVCRFSSAGNRQVTRAVRYMYRHLDRELTLAELSAAMGTSPSTLSAVFRQCTGHAPMDFFTRLKMKQACRMLRSGGEYVYEVARQLGYRDPYYFSRAFKKVMGVSPRSYQNGLGRSDPPGDEET